ncbi:MAG: hypothetical protein KGV57_04660 [Fusobacterium sp.]|nr:hypothetical protein [Fusobacterium sp.]
MEEKYKVLNILDKMAEFHKKDIVIKGKSKEFDILFKKESIPHLLGLQYTIKDNLKGSKLLKYILKNQFSDTEILKLVNKNYGELQKEKVKNRIETFEEFMNNLEKGIIVEKTLNTKMFVNYLIIEKEKDDFLHLGILSGDNGALLEEYEDLSKEEKDILRSYFVENNIDYFNKTKVNERVEGIYQYDEDYNLVPFSFDKEKQKSLDIAWKKEKNNFNYKKSLENIKEEKKKNPKIPKKKKDKEVGKER